VILDPSPLRSRSAVVTGVSRRAGIGVAGAQRLLELGARVFVHSWVPHDETSDLGVPIRADLTRFSPSWLASAKWSTSVPTSPNQTHREPSSQPHTAPSATLTSWW
jgi:hypothetical protein